MIEDAGGVSGYEFQRLHGMGHALYELLLDERPDAAVRVYAPVGGHRDLLAYLVRRLLENGANSSFVSAVADPAVPVSVLLKRPQAWIGDARHARHPKVPLPRDLYAPSRRNSQGVEFGDRASLAALVASARDAVVPRLATPLVDGIALPGIERDVRSPIDGTRDRPRARNRRRHGGGRDDGRERWLSGLERDRHRGPRRRARARRATCSKRTAAA